MKWIRKKAQKKGNQDKLSSLYAFSERSSDKRVQIRAANQHAVDFFPNKDGVAKAEQAL